MNLNIKHLLFGILSLGIFLIFLSIGLHYWSGGKSTNDNGIVINAENSKTEFILYSWSSSKTKNTGMVSKVELVNLDQKLTDTIEEKTLTENLNKLNGKLDSSSNKKVTPIYLGATDGMRILHISDYGKADQIIVDTKENLKKYSESQKKYNVKDVEIISGEKESLYSWISANHLMSLLTKGDKTKTVGILDMGDISAHTAFPVESTPEPKENEKENENKKENENEKKNLNNKGIEKTSLFGTEHEVYTHSNLCVGKTQIINRYLISLIIETTIGKSEIENPCSHKDQPDFTVSQQELITGYCTNNEFVKKLVTLPSYTFQSKPNVEKCRKVTEKLTDVNYIKSVYKDFSFEPISQVLSDEVKFYALNYLYESASQLKEGDSISFKDEEEFTTETQKYCEKPWEEIIKDHKEQEKEFRDYCFSLNYILYSLKNVNSFSGPQFAKIEFKSKLNGNDLSWPLGYMLEATNSITGGDVTDPALKTTGFVLLFILGFLFAAGSLFILYKKNFFKR